MPAHQEKQTRPVAPPLSLVKDKAGHSHDVALCEGPLLIRGAAPIFSTDWKTRSDVDKHFGWPFLKRELRVRTAMNWDTRRALDENLFSYEMINTECRVWIGRADLSGIKNVEERKQAGAQLTGLLAVGLKGIGKTKVSVGVKVMNGGYDNSAQKSNLDIRDGYWLITLQTPSLLCDPNELNETSGRDELYKAYAQVWLQISGGSLELVRYFASQSLAGGKYLHDRFQANKPYYPWLLTDAGSVFVLKPVGGKEADAKRKVKYWVERGLDFPVWAKERYIKKTNDGRDGELWANCPYIAENGYGEIAVNLAVHWDKNAAKEVIHVL